MRFEFDLETVWLLREATALAAREAKGTKLKRLYAELSERTFLRRALLRDRCNRKLKAQGKHKKEGT